MKALKELWRFLSGKKTAIAFALLAASDIAGIWKAPEQVIQTLDYLGYALGGIGLLHKGAKVKAGVDAVREYEQIAAKHGLK